MAVRVKKIADDSLFNFTCAQWAMMEAADKADWTVLENTCGLVTQLSYPYASSEFFYTLDGLVAAEDPLQIQTVDGISTILFKDQPAGTVLAGPVSGPDDYPTFRALEISDLPDIIEYIEDTIGVILVDTDTVNLTYDDATPKITADVIYQMSIEADASGLKLVGDSASPGNNKLYGTNGSGAKGWYDQPAGGGLSDGDYGDITVSGGGTIMNIDANVVTDVELRQGAAASVIGRSAATIGNVADIVSTANHQVLRRNDTGALDWGLVGTDNIAAGAVTTVKIADDAVTYEKIQNVGNNNRVLGRVSGAGGNVEELTAAQMQTMLGYIDGALTNPRIPYASDANTLTDSANLQWLNATKEIMIGAGASLDARYSHREAGTFGADVYYGYGLIATQNTYIFRLENTRNQLNQGATKMLLQVGGASAADPFIEYIVASAGNNWTHGVDNSDSDKWKLTPKSTAPGSVANSGIIVTSAAAALVGINLDAPTYPLDVNGRARSTQLLNTQANPTAGPLQAGMGTGGAVNFLLGTNNGFFLTFTVGTAPTANSDLFKITLNTAFPGTYYPVFSQINKNAAQAYNQIYISNFDSSSLTLAVDGTLTAGEQYSFNFCFFGR